MHMTMVKYGHIYNYVKIWVQSLSFYCAFHRKTRIQSSIRAKKVWEGGTEGENLHFLSATNTGTSTTSDFKQSISVEGWHFTSSFYKGQMLSSLSDEENPRTLTLGRVGPWGKTNPDFLLLFDGKRFALCIPCSNLQSLIRFCLFC